MDLSKLIEKMGDDVIYQLLDECIVSVNSNKNRGSKITFLTDQINPHDLATLGHTKRQGFVIWLDRDKVREAFDKE